MHTDQVRRIVASFVEGARATYEIRPTLDTFDLNEVAQSVEQIATQCRDDAARTIAALNVWMGEFERINHDYSLPVSLRQSAETRHGYMSLVVRQLKAELVDIA